MTVVGLLAGRQLRRHGVRSALTAAGVACGVALVVAIRVINASTLTAFTNAIEDLAGTAVLQVRGQGPFPEAVAERLAAVPGIGHAVPIITATFFGVEAPITDEALSVFAADVTDGHAIRTLRLVKSGERVVEDPLAFLVDPYSIIVTDGLAARAALQIGAQLRLRTAAGLRTFTVRGVLPPGGVGRAFGGNLILMDVIGAQVVLGRERQIDQVDLTIEAGVLLEDVEDAVTAALPPGLEAIRPARRGEQIEDYLGSFQTLLAGVSGLALLAAVFIIGSAVAASVASRRREIGILRCVGAPRRQVACVALAEALAVGVVGTLAGLPFGIVLARLLLRTVTESTELIFSIEVFAAELEVTTATVILAIAAGVGTSAIAGWIPARDAALVSPLAALRAAEVGEPPRRWRLSRAIVAAVAVTGAALWIEVRFDSPWSGNVAALAADFALVLMYMRLAGPMALLLLRPLRRALGFPGRLAMDRLTQIPDQLALAAGILALALGLMLMSATLAASFEQSVLGFIRRQVRADLVVASTATTGWIEAPLPEALAARLLGIPGVARVEALRLAEHDHDGVRISIDSLDESAFDPGREADFTFSDGDPQAAVAAVQAGQGVLVSQNFARRFQAQVGTTLHLDTPAGPHAAPVVGIVVDYVSPRGSVILSRTTYRDRWQDTSVNRFHVTLATGREAGAVRHAIAREFGAAEHLKVLTQRELYEYHQDAVQRAFRLTLALKLLPLIVAGLGLAEALLAVSLDRRHEFALLRAAGATRGQVTRSVLAESAGVGLLGLGGGVLIGLALAVLWVRVNFVHQLGWQLDFHFATASIPTAALVALVVSVPAGLLPARRVARLSVLDALREG